MRYCQYPCLECADVIDSQNICLYCAWCGYFVSQYDVPLNVCSLLIHVNASVATIIRLKYLVALTNQTDLLCEQTPLPFNTPS